MLILCNDCVSTVVMVTPTESSECNHIHGQYYITDMACSLEERSGKEYIIRSDWTLRANTEVII